MLPNLGLARANQIKNIFQELGLEANRIQIDAQKSEDLFFPGDYLFGGATYSFHENTRGL